MNSHSCNAARDGLAIRALTAGDLPAYKALRDEMLAQYPSAYSSDARSERLKAAASYLQRLGSPGGPAGPFTLGAWQSARLVGAIGCERDLRLKVAHIGHVTGMMVHADAQRRGIGRALLAACIEAARSAAGLELLTLSVTSDNAAAVSLYEQAGFRRYGTLPHALKIGQAYCDKHLMLLEL